MFYIIIIKLDPFIYIFSRQKDSIIFKVFLDDQSKEYLNNTDDKRKVIDFIAGMTDEMFLREIQL